MKNIRRAIKYLGNYWQPTLGGGLALLIVNAANLATPQLLRALIDQGIMQLNMSRITQVIAGLVAIALVRGIFNFLQGYWSEMASQGVAYEMRNDIFEKLQNLSFSYHDQAHTGKLMTRMTSDVELVRMFVGRGALMMASALLMITGTMVLMFQMNWQLALVVFIVLPVILVIFSIFVRKIMPVSRNVQKKLGLLNSVLQENLVGMRVVKAFARELYEIERYAKQNDDLLEENINLIKLFVSVFPVIFYITPRYPWGS
jgi:ATP-binding cassette subfamily B protein